MSVLGQVMIDGAPPAIFAQSLPQHVEHSAASRIGIVIKHRIGVGVVLRHDRTTYTTHPVAIVRILIRLHVTVKKIITSQTVLVPHSLKVSGKTFIEPDVSPGTTSHVIAEPLVSQLV